jgi:hypothetical protein
MLTNLVKSVVKHRVTLTILLASALSLSPAQAENKTRPLYLSSIAAPAPAVVPGFKISPVTQVSVQYSKHFDQGVVFKKNGDNNRALIEFLQAIKENPRCTRAFFEQALIFRQKGYPKLAESSLCQALAVDPSYREARLLLATIRLESGNTGGAAQELTRSLGLPDAAKASPVVAKPQPVQTTQLVPQKPAEANSLLFRADNQQAKTAPATVPGSSQSSTNGSVARPLSKVVIDSDDWARRLKYLSVNGTGSLKPGEAFMFSEETGEAVLFLADGKRVRRIISAPTDTHELVKARRPDMLIPADLLYKLSTLGKLVGGDPSALIDLNDAEKAPELKDIKEIKDLDSLGQPGDEEPGKRESERKGSSKGTLADVMDSEDDTADNTFTRKSVLIDGPRDRALNPEIPADASKGPGLDSTEPASMKDFSKELGSSFGGSFTESFNEKSQKIFGWLKKTLHLQ